MLIGQAIMLFTLSIIYTQTDELAGFTLYEMMLVMGLSQLVRGLDLFYNDYIWVEAFKGFASGSLYYYMTKPLPIYFQIITMRVNTQSLAPITVGLCLISVYIRHQANFSTLDYIALLYFILMGLIILFSVKLITASLALWFGKSGQVMQLFYELIEFTKYPINIYHFSIQILLLYVIPLGVIGFIPVLFWKDDLFFFQNLPLSKNMLLVSYSGLSAAVFFLLSLFIWKKGLRYSGASGT